MRFPRPLIPGSRVRVVASSGPFDVDLLNRGIARLSERYQVAFDAGLPSRRTGFLAGSDEERTAELQTALDDPSLEALILARGGYGLGRILPRLDFSRFLREPRWFVGFSDATVLHSALNTLGVGTIHGPNGTTLATAREEDVSGLFDALEGRLVSLAFETKGSVRTTASLEGRLFGGNLTMLFSEAASNRLKAPEGAVVLLEDVGETSYRVDRMLTALLDRGYFDAARAVLLGDFTECSSGKFGVPVETVLDERLGRLGIPLVRGVPVGHGTRNASLVLGASTRVDLDRGRLEQQLG